MPTSDKLQKRRDGRARNLAGILSEVGEHCARENASAYIPGAIAELAMAIDDHAEAMERCKDDLVWALTDPSNPIGQASQALWSARTSKRD